MKKSLDVLQNMSRINHLTINTRLSQMSQLYCVVVITILWGYCFDANAKKPSPCNCLNTDWRDVFPVRLDSRVTDIDKESKIYQILYSKKWHDRNVGEYNSSVNTPFGWDINYFFEGELEKKLCEAINNRDIKNMCHLIRSGADVNVVGKEGMTLLYWSFFINDDPRPFYCLLKNGANPNIICSLKANYPLHIAQSGKAVVHLVSIGTYNRLFKEVFESGGNPNLVCKGNQWSGKRSPLFLISPLAKDCPERLQVLIDAGADITSKDQRSGLGFCNWMITEDRSEIGYHCALIAYKNGADINELLPFGGDKIKAFDILTSPDFENDPESMAEESYYHQLMEYLDSRY